jgi:RimJ/RimL family protein N-acetyltransferase
VSVEPANTDSAIGAPADAADPELAGTGLPGLPELPEAPETTEPPDAGPVDRHDEDVLVELKDGSKVLIRQVHHDDVPLLEEGFSRLSAESRRLRFLTDKPRLTQAELRYFTHVDHHDHEAIGARDATDGRGLGIARFIRDPENPEVAEVAVAVVDDWQRRGLGTELLSRLFSRAREEGIHRFTALVDEDNQAVSALLKGLGGEIRAIQHEAGAVTYEIAPAPESLGAELQHVLRAFGRGELTAPEAVREVLARIVPERLHS